MAVIQLVATVVMHDCCLKRDVGVLRPIERAEGHGARTKRRIHRTGKLQLSETGSLDAPSEEFGSWQGSCKAAQKEAVVCERGAGGYLFLMGGSKGGDLALARSLPCTDVFTSALHAAPSGKGDNPHSS